MTPTKRNNLLMTKSKIRKKSLKKLLIRQKNQPLRRSLKLKSLSQNLLQRKIHKKKPNQRRNLRLSQRNLKLNLSLQALKKPQKLMHLLKMMVKPIKKLKTQKKLWIRPRLKLKKLSNPS
jgi:hypothetical protein